MPVLLGIDYSTGGAKSNVWRQIITDVFNVPTVLTKRKTGAPFGDAILAGVATGYFKDYFICKQLAEYVNMLEPSEKTIKNICNILHFIKKYITI